MATSSRTCRQLSGAAERGWPRHVAAAAWLIAGAPGALRLRLLLPTGPAPRTLPLSHLFPGTWAQPSDPQRTVEKNFHVNETTSVKVPMMFQSSSVKHLLDPELPCQVVQLDHTGNRTIFFVLPDPGQMDTVTAAMSRDMMERWSASLVRR